MVKVLGAAGTAGALVTDEGITASAEEDSGETTVWVWAGTVVEMVLLMVIWEVMTLGAVKTVVDPAVWIVAPIGHVVTVVLTTSVTITVLWTSGTAGADEAGTVPVS
jgi:hypothetical protein